MNYDENEFGTQDFTDPNNPSIIEPAGVGVGWLIMPFAAAFAVALLLLVVTVVLYVVLQYDAPVAPQPDAYTNPLKEPVPPSPETCALPDGLCQPGVGPEMPAEYRPDPYVVAPPPTSVPRPPATCPPQNPHTDQVIPSPDVVPN